jgi:hypothetical protein
MKPPVNKSIKIKHEETEETKVEQEQKNIRFFVFDSQRRW